MLFNSFSFLGAFSLLVVLHYAIARRWRWLLLACASVAYYSTFNPAHVLLLIGVAGTSYVTGLAIGPPSDAHRRKATMIAGIVVVLSALLIVKYSAFFMQSLAVLLAAFGIVPLIGSATLTPVAAAGLSFYTFSCVSYLADVYAGRVVPERHPGYFLTYVAFFPKLLAGPIERARPFLQQLRQPATFSEARLTAGLQLILWGLFKKVVVADRLGPFVDAAYSKPAFSPTADLLIATYFFAFQLYCDFSAYSDIAIGTSKVLGVDLAENFRRPYFSRSVSEFWSQRWHLSLATWFRDYVYIPLGGNRVSSPRRTFNVLAVFIASGLWHGANWTFVIWGGLNGIYTAIGTTLGASTVRSPSRPPTFLRTLGARLLTFHLILLTWVFFRASSVADAITVVARLGAGVWQLPQLVAQRVVAADVLPLCGLVFTLMVIETIDEHRSIWQRVNARPIYVRWGLYYAVLLTLVVFGNWNFRQFVYMQF